VTGVGGPGALATAAGTLCAVVGTYLCLVVLVLASRLPWLERGLGHDGMLALHRRLGPWSLGLIAAHALFSSAGFAWGLGRRLVPGTWALMRTGDWMLPATAGFALMIGAGVLCVPAVRHRLRYETWWVTHLYLYLAVALSFGHQLVLSPVFAGGTRARAWWIALYVVTGAALLCGRVALPVTRSLWLGLRVEKIVAEGPDACSVYLTGRHLKRLRVSGGQFFQWRFLTRHRWWQAHPYSLSAAPDGRRLRITVRNLGDHSGGLRHLRPGTRVVIEGPYGVFTADRRRSTHVVALAAGIGITPVRAMLEELPPRTRVHLLYAMSDPETAPLLAELRELRFERGWTLIELSGSRRKLDAALLLDLVPGLADADVFVCGPEGFRTDAEGALRAAGVTADRVHTEVFAFASAPPAGSAPARPLGPPLLRALAATGGTLAGLAAVLGYSPFDDGPRATDLSASPVGLGAPVPLPSPGASPARAAHAKPHPPRTPVPTITPTPTPAPTPSPHPSARPTPHPTPRPTPKPLPTLKPLPTPKPPADPVALREVVGPTVSFAWGDLQVAIKVAGTRVVDAWAVTAPGGHSQLFTQQAIPTLRSETLAAQSADIAAVSGASMTSTAWKQSLAAALTQAGL
jgi:predicted ferric reductase